MISLVDVSRLQECLLAAQQALDTAKSSGQQSAKVLASFSMPWCSSAFRPQQHISMAPMAFLSANVNHIEPICFWASPQPRWFSVGLGAALELDDVSDGQTANKWSELQTKWQQLLRGAVIFGDHQPTLFGGFAFDKQKPCSSKWQDFPQASLTLPQFVLSTQKQAKDEDNYSHTLIINCLVDEHTDAHGLSYQLAAKWQMLVARVANLNAKNSESNSTYNQSDIEPSTADKDIWQSRVANAVAAIHNDAMPEVMQKVVLARGDTLNIDCCPGELLNDLAQRFPQAYLFAFARGESCFFGATPERLLSCNKGKIATVALAGSAPRGSSELADQQLGEALLNSEKDRVEHDMVVQHLHGILSEHCETVSFDRVPKLHKLAQIQHLLTPMHGAAKGEVVLLDVLESMHPSAAVGGLPRELALDYIREHENLDRGWYAAPVGWLDANGDGEFAVALRSALINLKNHDMTLFAGCGIVAASNPVHEYRESCIKMNAIREAIRSVIRVPELFE